MYPVLMPRTLRTLRVQTWTLSFSATHRDNKLRGPTGKPATMWETFLNCLVNSLVHVIIKAFDKKF